METTDSVESTHNLIQRLYSEEFGSDSVSATLASLVPSLADDQLLSEVIGDEHRTFVADQHLIELTRMVHKLMPSTVSCTSPIGTQKELSDALALLHTECARSREWLLTARRCATEVAQLETFNARLRRDTEKIEAERAAHQRALEDTVAGREAAAEAAANATRLLAEERERGEREQATLTERADTVAATLEGLILDRQSADDALATVLAQRRAAEAEAAQRLRDARAQLAAVRKRAAAARKLLTDASRRLQRASTAEEDAAARVAAEDVLAAGLEGNRDAADRATAADAQRRQDILETQRLLAVKRAEAAAAEADAAEAEAAALKAAEPRVVGNSHATESMVARTVQIRARISELMQQTSAVEIQLRDVQRENAGMDVRIHDLRAAQLTNSTDEDSRSRTPPARQSTPQPFQPTRATPFPSPVASRAPLPPRAPAPFIPPPVFPPPNFNDAASSSSYHDSCAPLLGGFCPPNVLENGFGFGLLQPTVIVPFTPEKDRRSSPDCSGDGFALDI